MHILLIHQAFAALDEAGGTRHYEMARHLARRGHRITIITSPVSYLTGSARPGRIHWCEKETPEPGITILRTYTFRALHRSFLHRLLSFFSFMFSSFWVGLGVRKVDLVWGTSPPIFQGFTAWLLARLKRTRFLFEVRDLWPLFAIAVGVLHNKLLIRLSQWLEHFLYRHADRVLVNSPGFIAHVRERGAKHIELIPNGADPAMFTPDADSSEFRQLHHLENKFIALYAGAHGMSNDLGIILSAAQLLKDKSNIHFVLVGDGKEKANLQRQAEELTLSNVLFLPPVPKEEMAGVLAAADAGIAILKPLDAYKTTYPNKVFDYMASGRPVICVIDGAIRQVVEEAGCGVFVPPGDARALSDAVLTLAADPARARQMGIAGRKDIEAHFSRTLLADKFQQLVEEMVAVRHS
jgi:glycosyltransferase involved in cell wall biosynthesis